MGLFSRSSDDMAITALERQILSDMPGYEWKSPLMITSLGISLEDAQAAMSRLEQRGLLFRDAQQQFVSKYDPTPRFQITSKGRKALKQ